MVRRRLLTPRNRDYVLTAAGARFLGRLGVDVEATRRERRRTSRAPSARRWRGGVSSFAMQRVAEERTLTLSPLGVRGLRMWFGINWTRRP
jgi:hypothetical protein